MHYLQTLYIMNLFHQVDHLCVLKTKVALVLRHLTIQTNSLFLTLKTAKLVQLQHHKPLT